MVATGAGMLEHGRLVVALSVCRGREMLLKSRGNSSFSFTNIGARARDGVLPCTWDMVHKAIGFWFLKLVLGFDHYFAQGAT